MSEPESTEKKVLEEAKEPVEESTTDEGEATQNETPAQTDEGEATRNETPAQTDEGEATQNKTPAQTDEGEATQNETPAQTDEGEATQNEIPAQTDKGEVIQDETPAQTDEGEATRNETPAQEPSKEPEANTSEQAPQTSQPTPPLPAAPKVKHDWYQTHSDVCVNVMIKRLKRDDVTVDFTENSMRVWIDLGDGKDCSLAFQLAHQIVPQRSSFKVLSTKVEVKMRKVEGLQWSSLEETKEPGKQHKLPQMEEAKDDVHKYPSSSHYTRNWDKLVAEVKQEEKDEKLEGDAALNKLFQQIYRDGSDEVKKAMNKSFSESGGTVLSTNWGEVGTKPVERKPPDGMEWKSYQN